MTKYYPIFLKLENKEVVVIGGGKVAERKINTLLEYGAKVKVISPELTPRLKDLAEKGKILWVNRAYQKGDLEGAYLVIAATNDPGTQKAVFSEAEEKKIPCNVVDNPEYCSFIVPSTIKRGDLTIAISTGGANPAVARRIRESLEEYFGKEFELYLVLMKKIREEILKSNLSQEQKENKIQIFALAPLADYIKNKNFSLLYTILEKEGLAYLLPEILSLCKASTNT
ncbi:MAG: bifunctional precorrin-2 dehydrogenase/sirohydrochlorin ferrochelatase [Caldimicrobium sp.]